MMAGRLLLTAAAPWRHVASLSLYSWSLLDPLLSAAMESGGGSRRTASSLLVREQSGAQCEATGFRHAKASISRIESIFAPNGTPSASRDGPHDAGRAPNDVELVCSSRAGSTRLPGRQHSTKGVRPGRCCGSEGRTAAPASVNRLATREPSSQPHARRNLHKSEEHRMRIHGVAAAARTARMVGGRGGVGDRGSPGAMRERGGDDEQEEEEEVVVLYQGWGMRVFSLLVRLKVLQLVGFAAAVVPVTTFLSDGELPVQQGLMAAAVLAGSTVASAALWFYSHRYVGELALLLPEEKVVRFSVMDFWGDRAETYVDVRAVVPPFQGASDAEVRAAALALFVPMDVIGDRQYFLSLARGRVLDGQRLKRLMTGLPLRDAHDPPSPP